MAKSPSLARIPFLFFRPSEPTMALSSASPILSFSLPQSRLKLLNPSKTLLFNIHFSFFSTTPTPFPLQYEMIVSRPSQSSLTQNRRRPSRLGTSDSPNSTNSPESEATDLPTLPSSSESGFGDWVDRKLASKQAGLNDPDMDKSKRKYYSKRRKKMYGSDSDGERGDGRDEFVELQPEVVELPTLHKREEELYFYDTFAYPWEKEKHYKMVYQLEKKYFPDQCLDKAFLQPGESNSKRNAKAKAKHLSVKGKGKGVEGKGKEKEKSMGGGGGGEEEDKGLVFFDDEKDGVGSAKDVKVDVSEKKVEDFFKCLKKVPNAEVDTEPYIVTRNGELPPTWDGPNGTVVLVNKPKGWTSFTVCGKLRRLVSVKKVGHAGTLDPMATGLLIVCVGKATKIVDRFQGMIKSYSGIFRLGEATSTWDADSPIIQREPWEHIKDDQIKKAVASFCGEIWQVPPMFSAIKVGGERMYDKARRGESIELSPRRVSIFQFDIVRSLSDRQNLIFRVTCSKGTYIRSLCADLGKALGCCAHLTALRRDSIGQYSADDAWEFSELEEAVTKGYL